MAAAFLSACAGKSGSAGGASGDDQDFLNQLTLFVENIQAERIDRAMNMLSPEEKARFGTDPDPSSLARRLGSLRLSTLAKRPGVRLGPKGLEGIYDELPQFGRARPTDAVEESASPMDESGEPGPSTEEDSLFPSDSSPSEGESGSFEGLDESGEEVPLPMP